MSRRDPPPGERLERMVTELKSAGMSYRSIADAAGVGPTTVWRAGVGDLRDPSHDAYSRIEAVHAARCGQTRKHSF